MDALRTNSIKVVGRLSHTDLKEGRRQSDGQGFISGTITVVSSIGGASKEFELQLFAYEQTADKKPNKLYLSYSKLADLVGRKVEVSGELRENRYFSKNSKQMVSAQTLSGRFIRGVPETTADEAKYEVGGFIVSPLTEKKNKDGEIYRYDIQLGQGNYNYTSASIFTLHVRPTDVEIIKGLQNNYRVGDTVVLNGELDHIVQVVTKEASNVGFGTGSVHTFTNKQRNYWIAGGSIVIKNVEEGAYSGELINSLIGAYKAKDVELANAAASGATVADDVEDKPVISNRQSSLI